MCPGEFEFHFVPLAHCVILSTSVSDYFALARLQRGALYQTNREPPNKASLALSILWALFPGPYLGHHLAMDHAVRHEDAGGAAKEIEGRSVETGGFAAGFLGDEDRGGVVPW